MKKLGRLLIPVTLFAAAMGYLEAVVVVYLRGLLPTIINISNISDYTSFLNELLQTPMYQTEQTRELATIIMLIIFAGLLGKNLLQKLAVFLYTFGVWDIVYYISLFVLLRWPQNLYTMDILFLIPGPWIAPVYVPVVASIIMIGIGLYIMHRDL